MWPYYLYGRLIAVLEQGARAHGEVPWLEQYYPRGFFPLAGLREPLERHRHSVLNYLTRRDRAATYMARLNWLASALDSSDETITFNTWASQCLSYDERRRPEVPDRSTRKTLRYTPRAAWTNAGSYSPAGKHCRRTRASGSPAGTTTRAGTSPSTSPATTPGCRQEPSWALPTAGRSPRPRPGGPPKPASKDSS